MTIRPLMYAGASLLLASAVFYFVFPGFVDTYSETGGALPAITQVAIDLTNGKLIYGWAVLFGGALLSIAALASVRKMTDSPARRDAYRLAASSITTIMLLVAAFYLAAVVTPMFSANPENPS